MATRKRFELRFTEEQYEALGRAARARGFPSLTAYVQAVLKHAVSNPDGDSDDRHAFVAASIDRLSKEVRTVHTAQQAVFAAIDSLTRLFLTCIPEPSPEVLDQAKRKARVRYDRFLVSVAQNMASDSRSTMAELTDRA
jgi:hypothetical protein